jgi:predicted RNase H-like nuclease (RuvC/YqgF family)
MIATREPTEEDRKSYWFKAYKSMEQTAMKLQGENEQLRQILSAQIRTNDMVGERMASQDKLMEDNFNDRNTEAAAMGAELVRLRQKVKELGGDLD